MPCIMETRQTIKARIMGLLLNKIILAVVGVVLVGGTLLLSTGAQKNNTPFDEFALPEEEIVRVPFGEVGRGARQGMFTSYFEEKKTTGSFLLDAISGITSGITKTLEKSGTLEPYAAGEIQAPPSGPPPFPGGIVQCLGSDGETLSNLVLLELAKYIELYCPQYQPSGPTISQFYKEWKKGCTDDDIYLEEPGNCPVTNNLFSAGCPGFKEFFSKTTSCEPIGGPPPGGIGGGGQGAKQSFGGKVESIDHQCCDGSSIITVGDPNGAQILVGEAVGTRIYSEYNTTGTGQSVVGLYQSGGTCFTIASECEESESPDDGTATSIGTSKN